MSDKKTDLDAEMAGVIAAANFELSEHGGAWPWLATISNPTRVGFADAAECYGVGATPEAALAKLLAEIRGRVSP